MGMQDGRISRHGHAVCVSPTDLRLVELRKEGSSLAADVIPEKLPHLWHSQPPKNHQTSATGLGPDRVEQKCDDEWNNIYQP